MRRRTKLLLILTAAGAGACAFALSAGLLGIAARMAGL